MVYENVIGFVESQVAHVERDVYEVEYGDIQYMRFVPVSTEAHPWADSILYYSMDGYGQAQWFNPQSSDVPLAETNRQQFTRTIEGASLGYTYHLGEIGQAMMVPGVNLPTDRARYAMRGSHEFCDDVALRGSDEMGWEGLTNMPSTLITPNNAKENSDSDRNWNDKSAIEVAQDINDAITRVWKDTLHRRIPNMVALPSDPFSYIVNTPIGDNAERTIYDYVMDNNIYSKETGNDLTISSLRGLEDSGVGSTGRMITYCLDDEVLKFHMPMPFRFLPVFQTGPMTFLVAGFMRMGGLEVRLPKCIDYTDQIWPAA